MESLPRKWNEKSVGGKECELKKAEIMYKKNISRGYALIQF